MAEYKSNSYKSRAEKSASPDTGDKHIQKVVNGRVTTKRNDARKFANLFISEDVSNVKSYVLLDVLVPAIKKAILDIVTDGADMILYGGESKSKRSGSSSRSVSYRSYYDDQRDRSRSTRNMNRFDYDDIVFESRGEAELVKEQMMDIVDKYGMVTVGDMYDMAGLTAPYTATKYGWFSIRTAETIRTKDGYILKLPKAMPMD